MFQKNILAGAPGHVFLIPNGSGGEKGPDTTAEAFRQMLGQHLVRTFSISICYQ